MIKKIPLVLIGLFLTTITFAQYRVGGVSGPFAPIQNPLGTAYLAFNQNGTNIQIVVSNTLSVLSMISPDVFQSYSATLDEWAAISPSAKQNALGFTPLTALQSSNAAITKITDGTQPAAFSSVSAGSANISGMTVVTLTASSAISGPASGLTSIPAAQLAGTIDIARLPAAAARVDDMAAMYQPLDADLTSIAAVTTTSFGRGLLDEADGAAVRATIGAGTSSFSGAYSALTSVPAPIGAAATNNASTLTNIQPSNIAWSGISVAAFTNGVAARIPVYTNGGTIYYLTLSTNTP